MTSASGTGLVRRKVLCVFGTRPDAIKMAPVVWALRRERNWCDLSVCVTAQHRHLLDPLLALFGITPDEDLDAMRENQSLTDLTGRMLAELADVLARRGPDWVIVQGDTTTAFVAALAAVYHRVRVAHVEAGLRTPTPASPFPEEMNRRLLGQMAALHLAPTERARGQLLAEGIDPRTIVVTGNTGIDALRWMASRTTGRELDDLGVRLDVPLVLVTTHRRESFGQPLQNICCAVRELAQRYARSLQIVWPVHPSPHVRVPVEQALAGLPNVHLAAPLPYPTMVSAIQRARFVLTDSGGIQEEAPSLGTPVLVLRDNTERPEGVDAGVARLVGTDPARIVSESRRLLDDEGIRAAMARPVDLYGDGHAGERVVDAIRERVGSES